jgi:hypothetical protein
MPDLNFQIEAVEAAPFAAAPLLHFRLWITNRDPNEWIQAVLLRCQIQIAVTRRHYSKSDQERLHDLFGEPARWGTTLKALLWTHVSVNVSSFEGQTMVVLPLPCSYDLNIATTKYFYALGDGSVPLTFLFSGTIFYADGEDTLQVAQIPWEKEAEFSIPVAVWKEMMTQHYPNSAWLYLHRDTFDRLYRYKMRKGLPTWEQALNSLLPPDEE